MLWKLRANMGRENQNLKLYFHSMFNPFQHDEFQLQQPLMNLHAFNDFIAPTITIYQIS